MNKQEIDRHTNNIKLISILEGISLELASDLYFTRLQDSKDRKRQDIILLVKLLVITYTIIPLLVHILHLTLPA